MNNEGDDLRFLYDLLAKELSRFPDCFEHVGDGMFIPSKQYYKGFNEQETTDGNGY